jgi:hypothetical protein
MGVFDKIFNRKKAITAKDLKVALMGVKRERKKKQMELRKLSHKKSEYVDQIKRARKGGNNLEVDFLWEELNQLKVDAAYSRREAKILNLEGIGLTRYIRGLERLEKTGSNEKIRDLLERVRTSGLDAKLYGQEIDEKAYMDALNATLEDVGLEIEEMEAYEDDPEKSRFLAEIDAINAAEEEGKIDEALERETELKAKIETEEPEAAI